VFCWWWCHSLTSFWYDQPLSSFYSWCLNMHLLGCSARGSLALALVRAPLRWSFDSCTFFHGSAFGLCQPSGQGIGLFLALSQRHPYFMPGLALRWCFILMPWLAVCLRFHASGFAATTVFLFIHRCQRLPVQHSSRWCSTMHTSPRRPRFLGCQGEQVGSPY